MAMIAFLSSNLPTAVYILFLIIIFIVTVLLTALLIMRVLKEHAKNQLSSSDGVILTFDALKNNIVALINSAKRDTTFMLYRVDLDDYNGIYKSMGDISTNNLIRNISSAMCKLLPWGIRISDTGDGAIYILINNTGEHDSELFSKLLIKTCKECGRKNESFPIEINANVSLCEYPLAGNNINELLENLEIAMVVSKRKGVDSFIAFNEQISSSESSEYKYYKEIQDAMKDREFRLFYQPIINVTNDEVISGESLMRWHHKVRGILPPSEFLYIMEKTGDIKWVGKWCFEQMVKQLATWHNNYEQRFVVAINLSEMQLLDPEYPAELRSIVKKNKSNPHSFVIEIDDENLHNPSDIVKQNINKYREYGFFIALDRFNLRQENLTDLEKLEVDAIKIDRKLWLDSQKSPLIKELLNILIKLTQQKHIDIVACGVEHREEMEMLKSLGIKFMQGYYFSAPKEPGEFISEVVMTPWVSKNIDGE